MSLIDIRVSYQFIFNFDNPTVRHAQEGLYSLLYTDFAIIPMEIILNETILSQNHFSRQSVIIYIG